MSGERNYQIRRANVDDWDKVTRLAWVTFLEFEAEDYGEEGIENFRDFLVDEKLNRMFLLGEYVVFVAEDRDGILGMISLRNGNHLSLLFVDSKHHRQGIGGALLSEMEHYLKEEDRKSITVDAAPYALDFYLRRGYVPEGPERTTAGIRYTPMKKKL